MSRTCKQSVKFPISIAITMQPSGVLTAADCSMLSVCILDSGLLGLLPAVTFNAHAFISINATTASFTPYHHTLQLTNINLSRTHGTWNISAMASHGPGTVALPPYNRIHWLIYHDVCFPDSYIPYHRHPLCSCCLVSETKLRFLAYPC